MASVSKAHSSPSAQSAEQIRREFRSSGEMECMPIESEIVDASIVDEAIQAQQRHVVAVRRELTKLEIELHFASDMPSIELGVMHERRRNSCKP